MPKKHPRSRRSFCPQRILPSVLSILWRRIEVSLSPRKLRARNAAPQDTEVTILGLPHWEGRRDDLGPTQPSPEPIPDDSVLDSHFAAPWVIRTGRAAADAIQLTTGTSDRRCLQTGSSRSSYQGWLSRLGPPPRLLGSSFKLGGARRYVCEPAGEMSRGGLPRGAKLSWINEYGKGIKC
jgi:hypothetical protein